MAKEIKVVRKITAGSIFSWIFGVFFLLSGAVIMPSSPVPGLIIVLCSAMIIPYFNTLAAEKFNFKISGGIKFLLFIVIIVTIGFAAMNNAPSEISQEKVAEINKKQQEQQQATEPELYYIGDKVEIGSFAYTINSYYTTDMIGQSIGGTFMGEEASGIFLVLDVTIENIAKESKRVSASYIKIGDDQERTFEHSSSAEIYLEDNQNFIFEQMQPGLPKTGKIVFDVPEDINGRLEISSDGWSSDKKYILLTERP